MQKPLVYRINDVCRIIGVTRTTIYRWVQQGELTLVKLGPNTSGISRASLEAWAAARDMTLQSHSIKHTKPITSSGDHMQFQLFGVDVSGFRLAPTLIVFNIGPLTTKGDYVMLYMTERGPIINYTEMPFPIGTVAEFRQYVTSRDDSARFKTVVSVIEDLIETFESADDD
jgi:excisionase family DNA binding protein